MRTTVPDIGALDVAMVSEHASPLAALGGVDAGGQNVYVAALSTALAARGHRVVVYTRRDDRALPRRARLAPGVQVVHLDAGPPEPVSKDLLLPHMPAFTDALTTALSADRPALVHAHFWMSGMAALATGARLGLPVVQTFHALGAVKQRHQGAADTSPRGRLDIERQLARGADRVIASCTDEVAELLALGAARAAIDVVPCGVDITQFHPGSALHPGGPRARPRLLVLGRMVPRKGVDDAIRALALLPDATDAELVIAGGPPLAQLAADPEARRLAALAAELGVADRVDLRGQVTRADLPALIRSADLVVCLPWYEPFGIVPLEAMACGVPVVGSAVGGLLDTVVDGVTGRLVAPRRPQAAAEAIAELLADDVARATAGAAGAARMRAGYSWDAVAAATERAYARTGVGPRGRGFDTRVTAIDARSGGATTARNTGPSSVGTGRGTGKAGAPGAASDVSEEATG